MLNSSIKSAQLEQFIGKVNNEVLIEKLIEDIWNDYYIKYK